MQHCQLPLPISQRCLLAIPCHADILSNKASSADSWRATRGGASPQFRGHLHTGSNFLVFEPLVTLVTLVACFWVGSTGSRHHLPDEAHPTWIFLLIALMFIWIPICSLFAFGKAVGEQIVGQGMAKSKSFAPRIFCCSARLVCSKFLRHAKEALNLETFLVTKGNKYIKQKCRHELQELQALIFSGRRHKASG